MYNEDRQVYSKMLRDTNYSMDSFIWFQLHLKLRFKLSPITHRVCIYAAFRGEIKPNETDQRDSYYT